MVVLDMKDEECVEGLHHMPCREVQLGTFVLRVGEAKLTFALINDGRDDCKQRRLTLLKDMLAVIEVSPTSPMKPLPPLA